MAAALGVERVELPELEERILFLRGDEIWLADRRMYHPEKPYDRTVFLDISTLDGSTRTRKFEIVSCDAAVFTLRCSSSGNRRNMMLVATASERVH